MQLNRQAENRIVSAFHELPQPVVRREGTNRLGLSELLKRYADKQWEAVHLTPNQAAESLLDCFKWAVAGELALLDLDCKEAQPDG